MDPTDNTGKAAKPVRAAPLAADATRAAPIPVTDHPFGPDAAAILATEHWSLLGSRSLLWNEAMSRTTIFLSVLSAAIVALALLANATGFGPQTTTLALVLLPVVFFLGIGTHSRVVEINQVEVELVLAMNRLRHAYLEIAPLWSPTSPPATTTTSKAWRPATCLPASMAVVWDGGAGSWPAPRPSLPPWTPPLPRRSSCSLCGRPRQPRRWSWRRGRWRS
jgi:hypothetical protein